MQERCIRDIFASALAVLSALPTMAAPLDPTNYGNPNGNTKVTMEADAALSYELYIPPAIAAQPPFTMIFAFTPDGNGKSLLLRLDQAAAERGWGLAVLNDSSNNNTVMETIAMQEKMLADIDARLSIKASGHIATGWSGGSRSGIMMAGHYPGRFIGALSMGAGTNGSFWQEPLNPAAGVYAIIGRSDQNFYVGDISDMQNLLLFDGVHCYVEPFNGGHTMPSDALISKGMAWLAQHAQANPGPNYESCEAGMGLDNSPVVFAWDSRTSQLAGAYNCYQRLGEMGGKVKSITWWGSPWRYNSSLGFFVGCIRSSESFRISFLTEENGEPKDAVWAQTVTPEERVYTAHVWQPLEIFRYTYTLPEPIDIADAKWLRIAGVGGDGCYWAWQGAPSLEPALQLDTARLGQPGAYAPLDYGMAVCIETDAPAPEAEVEGAMEGEGLPDGEGEGGGEAIAEGAEDGGIEGGDEGTSEGGGELEAEAPVFHSADIDEDYRINLSELLRMVQLFGMGGYHCAEVPGDDGLIAGPDIGARNCTPSDADYAPQDWTIQLQELLRQVQFYNAAAYHPCESEDGFCV